MRRFTRTGRILCVRKRQMPANGAGFNKPEKAKSDRQQKQGCETHTRFSKTFHHGKVNKNRATLSEL
jgi:hypothetical protein